MIEPLLYPNVGLSMDESLLPPGMRAWFDTPLQGDAYLNAAADAVTATIDVGDTVPGGFYPLTFTGSSGDMKRGQTVYVLVNPQPTDLRMTGEYELWGEDHITFTFTAANLGTGRGDGAQVSISLPPGITNVTWSCLGSGEVVCGSGTGDVLDWIGNFLPGETATYTVSGRIKRTTPFQVTADLFWLGVDTNPANNHTTLEGQVVFIPVLRK